jgi:hypothetical protein
MQNDPSHSGHTAQHPIVAVILIVCTMAFGAGVVVGYALGKVAQ